MWCRHTDSNCGPTDYKSVALPTELCRRCAMNSTEKKIGCKPKNERLNFYKEDDCRMPTAVVGMDKIK